MNNGNSSLMIEASQLTKVYRTPASQVTVFENLSVQVQRGKLIGVIGPSGAGKSTLLHLLGGLDTPTKGTVLFDGANIFNWNATELAHFRNSHIGFVFQFHHLLPEFTVLENTMMPMMIRGNVVGDMKQAAIDLLQRVGLGHRIAHQVGEISGGEQQRVAIARSLVGKPQLFLADEPTGNLDHRTGLTIFDMIRELHVERGLTSVIATHNEKLASQCDEVWELNEGVFALARL
jgi:lipoprotein-releasing system ATP-binding protein